jgi:hypothetical protein
MDDQTEGKYQDIHNSNEIIIKEIIGKQLNDLKVHIVEPEYNIVFMQFDRSWYGINGAVGSEILEIKRYLKTKHVKNSEFKPYNDFLGHKISNCRFFGDVWNGYGLEFSFQGIFDKTIIIQSIYTGDNPTGFEDCLRLGIGHYYYNARNN